MATEKQIKVGDILPGNMRVDEIRNGRVWGLTYIGKVFIARIGEKYLRSIYRDANTGNIKDTWASKKWANHFRPRESPMDISEYCIEVIATFYPEAVIEEVNE